MGWLWTNHMTLEVFMEFELKSEPGRAAARWSLLEHHPVLSESRLRMAAACLNYGLAIVNHGATRESLFGIVQQAAEGLVAGDAVMAFPEWPLPVKDLRLSIWPWHLCAPNDLEEARRPGHGSSKTARTFTCVLKANAPDSLWATVKCSFGFENILVPSAGLIPLYILSEGLDSKDRMRLGEALLAMNQFWRDRSATVSVGSERKAFRSAYAILAG